jgi:hypothetical protein
MSTNGVQNRIVTAIIRSNGRVTSDAYKEIVDYSRLQGIKDGELTALLDPKFLVDHPKLRAAGITMDRIVFDDGANAQAEALYARCRKQADRLGLKIHLPRGNQPPAPPPPPQGALGEAMRKLEAAMLKGANLGGIGDWNQQTTGADVRFSIKVGDKEYPALVLTTPDFKDPAPRPVLQESIAAFRALDTADGFKAYVEQLLDREKAYFDVEGVAVKSNNERYGIATKRRDAFFDEISKAIGETAVPAAGRESLGYATLALKESLVVNRDYNMETGQHTNYWPYWNNYASFLVKMIDQTPRNTPEYETIKNRLRDIYTRKTVFTWSRQVDERDFEASIGGALIYNPKYSEGIGHRISLAAGSDEFNPKYELLSVKKDGLPANLQPYAGFQVYRDTDPQGTLRFDFSGEGSEQRAGKEIPPELKAAIESRPLQRNEYDGITIRKLVDGEQARGKISADWDQNGAINVARIMIGWWGHCHNESPLNAMGVNPQKGVSMYRADRGVAIDKALQVYGIEDAWNVAGAFAADHEGNPEYAALQGGHPVEIDKTTFVGTRNNGGHYLKLTFVDGAQPRTFDTEVTRLWHRAEAGQAPEEYPDPMARFRRDIEGADGTFSPNQDWIAAGARPDEIIIDGKNRMMELHLKYITFGEDGRLTQREEDVTIDPSKDEWTRLGEEITDRYPDGGGKVTEHRYNAKLNQYEPIIWDVKRNAQGAFERAELTRGTKHEAKTVEVQQETTYDSVKEIHDFVTEKMGLPFVFDTCSGMAVWNYPVNHVRIDRQSEVERIEDGQKYTYTKYQLAYDTMGGPSGQAAYIIKRNDKGEHIRSTAVDPMPDFAFRNEKWVCAPVAVDDNGTAAFNVMARRQGYLTDKDGNIVPALWRRQAEILFASISEKTADGNAYIFADAKGQLFTFANQADFDAAVQADLEVRKLQA